MNNEPPLSSDLTDLPNTKICGVNIVLIEQFLLLIKTNYKKADKATFFLELRAGVSNVTGITNSRDVLSHLVTALDPELTDDQRREQLVNACEHMRRAVIEPYEITLQMRLDRFQGVYNQYVQTVIPVKDKFVELHSAPNLTTVQARLRQIKQLFAEGRASKNGNIWNDDWELGVMHYVDAVDQAESLETELTEYIGKIKELSSRRISFWIAVISVLLGAAGIILAIFMLLFPAFGQILRSLLGLS